MPNQPANDALQQHLDRTGTDVRSWTPEQRSEYSKLSDAATREAQPSK